MCGITGWVDFTDNLIGQDALISAMAEKLSPRGPDAGGTFLEKHVALGHRRLIVVDPAGGTQPMTRSFEGKNYTIVYNGELYNTLEIRQQLAARGHRFLSTNSDTEVLLTAYIEWGAKCLERLNGIFAFAVWDEKAEQLFMARDRLGVKPLFNRTKGRSSVVA